MPPLPRLYRDSSGTPGKADGLTRSMGCTRDSLLCHPERPLLPERITVAFGRCLTPGVNARARLLLGREEITFGPHDDGLRNGGAPSAPERDATERSVSQGLQAPDGRRCSRSATAACAIR